MALLRTGNTSSALTLVSQDLDAYATFNADATPGQGVLLAGVFMKYEEATKTLSKATIGTDVIFGVLADDVQTGPVGVTEVLPAMVYRRGVFLRQEIEAINDVTIDPGSALDLELIDLGIQLELSYE